MATTETGALLGSLRAQRAHVLGILEGLPDEALRRPVLPSGWTCLGLVQHLALDVERFWFQRVVAGERLAEDPDAAAAWSVPPDRAPAAVLERYRQESARADAIVTATPLDAAPRAWPRFFGSWRLEDLRAVVLHVITETACHAGHLDAARELLDGRTWLTLT